MKHLQSKIVRTVSKQSPNKEHASALHLTSSFTFDDAEEMRAAFADEIDRNIYSRFSNPTVNEFIEKLCILEKAEAGHATASGMAAVFATFATICSAGDHILSCRSIFGSTHSVLSKILPRWNINHSYVNVNETESWNAAVTDKTKLLYIETPTNPGVDIIDLQWAGEFCKKHKILLVVDNCFATPVLQTPIDFGADLIIHSATKYLDGQGRVVGGAVVGKKELVKEILTFCRSTGAALSPFNAWVISSSLETLELRMQKHSSNAMELSTWLETQPNVENVRYPFLPSHPMYEIAKKQMLAGGGIVTFTIKGGIKKGKQFLNALQMCSLTANLGDTRTIVTHPASTTHAKLTEEERLASGITPGLVRVSVGLENVEDIIQDLNNALKV